VLQQLVGCPHQGLKVHNEFLAKGLKSKMILSVHDELVFEIHKTELNIVIALVIDIMENTIKLSVPLKIELKIGKYWGENIIS
jgi:DNA polymerase-1